MYTKIVKFCEFKKITISNMCQDLKIPRQVITNLKNRSIYNPHAGLSTENTIKIANYMGIPVDELIRGD